jgi:acyl-CoA thioesterase
MSAEDSLAELLAGAEQRSDGFALTVPETWHQGRTGYGGFSAALAFAAAQRAGGDLPPLRSAQIAFVGPLYGKVETRARVLRRGKNATWLSAEVLRAEEGEGEVGLAASFVFMGPVASSLHLNDSAPPADLIPVDEAAELQPGGFAPLFRRNHFDVRHALPRREDKLPEICWWVRPKAHAALSAPLSAVLSADGVPPAVMPLMHPGVLVSSMTWQVNMLTPQPATRDGWWLLRSVGTYAEAGCSSQQMQLWNADGAPILSGMQSLAVFG